MTDNFPGVEPRYAKYLSRLIRPFVNFDFFFVKGLRRTAVEALRLSPGSHVLDLGCGGGGSFPFLVQAVGETGSVTGVDLSQQSCENAVRRATKNGWQNVRVIEGPAQSVSLSGEYDGALMFAAPDVFASKVALANLLPSLKEQARSRFLVRNYPATQPGDS